MGIPISFFTVVLRKAVVEASYPGGLAAFLRRYPGPAEDERLLGLSFMSGGEVQEFSDLLRAFGYDFERGWALGEMMRGEWDRCVGIFFYPTRPGPAFGRGWVAVDILQEGDEVCIP